MGCRLLWRTHRPRREAGSRSTGATVPESHRAGPHAGGLSPGEARAVGPAVGLGGDPQAPLKTPPSFWAKLNRENST